MYINCIVDLNVDTPSINLILSDCRNPIRSLAAQFCKSLEVVLGVLVNEQFQDCNGANVIRNTKR